MLCEAVTACAAHTTVPQSRGQVKAELAEAIRTGHMVSNDESGTTLNKLYPHQYPAQAGAPSKSREEVRAGLIQALKTGDIMANEESGKKLNELYPIRYPPYN